MLRHGVGIPVVAMELKKAVNTVTKAGFARRNSTVIHVFPGALLLCIFCRAAATSVVEKGSTASC